MIDTLLANLDRLRPGRRVRARFGLAEDVCRRDAPSARERRRRPRRPADRRRCSSGLARELPVVLPLHPRGRAALAAAGLAAGGRLRIVEPLGYVEFLSLVRGARLVVTDSGGIQEETTVLGVPCLTVRPNTERPITITHGTNRLVEPDRSGASLRPSSPATFAGRPTGRRSGTATPATGSRASSRSWLKARSG